MRTLPGVVFLALISAVVGFAAQAAFETETRAGLGTESRRGIVTASQTGGVTASQTGVEMEIQTGRGMEGHPAMGPPDAPVTIVEFADFECARCGTMAGVLREVLANYPDEVRLVFRQLPIGSVNPRARKASEAALCAFDQGRFWEYHDALFEDQANLDDRSLEERAVRLGLDFVAFSACLGSGEKATAVERDIEAAIAAGAYTVPTLYINGEMLTGSWPYRDVADRVDAELYRILRRETVGSEAGP